MGLINQNIKDYITKTKFSSEITRKSTFRSKIRTPEMKLFAACRCANYHLNSNITSGKDNIAITNLDKIALDKIEPKNNDDISLLEALIGAFNKGDWNKVVAAYNNLGVGKTKPKKLAFAILISSYLASKTKRQTRKKIFGKLRLRTPKETEPNGPAKSTNSNLVNSQNTTENNATQPNFKREKQSTPSKDTTEQSQRKRSSFRKNFSNLISKPKQYTISSGSDGKEKNMTLEEVKNLISDIAANYNDSKNYKSDNQEKDQIELFKQIEKLNTDQQQHAFMEIETWTHNMFNFDDNQFIANLYGFDILDIVRPNTITQDIFTETLKFYKKYNWYFSSDENSQIPKYFKKIFNTEFNEDNFNKQMQQENVKYEDIFLKASSK